MPNAFSSTTAFITGSNRGLGRALVEELHARGAAKIYAASRTGEAVPKLARVVPVALDVTDPASIRAAAATARGVTLLVNNAGALASYSVLGAERDALARDLAVNYYGVLEVVRAFLPDLAPGAAIANVLSVVSLAAMPPLGGYSASKAAAWSLTQSLRGELRAKQIRVHAVFPGPIDTDMIRSFEMAKAPAGEVARAILDGIAAGEDDIAPDAMSRSVVATFATDPRALERQFSS